MRSKQPLNVSISALLTLWQSLSEGRPDYLSTCLLSACLRGCFSTYLPIFSYLSVCVPASLLSTRCLPISLLACFVFSVVCRVSFSIPSFSEKSSLAQEVIKSAYCFCSITLWDNRCCCCCCFMVFANKGTFFVFLIVNLIKRIF